ncbi:MAG TPA: 3-oxoacyl-[acyl-carrier-protein] synthase III C-terminal domain-containing protein [Gemmatimonadales bacterium]|nr:3-oxoacyl-[acyl-carrier-protein] synthase III C-terminal domain-containing protein [Gemmatimonadales bacterium]
MSPSVHGMRLDGVSAYAPEQVWSNARVAARLRLERMRTSARLRAAGNGQLSEEEAKLFETSDRWVRRFIGFSERRFCGEGMGTIDLAAGAARLLFEHSGHHARDIDGIVVGSVTPSYPYSPPDAALLQHELGIPIWQGPVPRQMMGADVSLACTSWVTSLMLCYSLIRAGLAQRILLIGADRMSATINWRDRSFATVLGDAGTATLCSAVPEGEDWFSPAQFWSWMDGGHAEIIRTPAGGSRRPSPTPEELEAGENRLTMDGAAVRTILVPFIGGPAMDAALAKAGWGFGELDLVSLHEANLTLNASIVKMWRERGFRGRVLDAGGRFGNTTSASIPLALALNPDALRVGAKFGLIGFGGGLSASLVFGTIRNPLRTWTNVTSSRAGEA